MYCEECKIRPATVHLAQMFNGQKIEVHLCEQCASQKGAIIFGTNNQLSISNLLGSFLGGDHSIQEAKSLVQNTSCPSCGIKLFDIRQTGKLGCAKCYMAFEQELGPSLRRIHGNRQHVGKIPLRGGEKVLWRKQMESLKQRLQEAVAREEYEEAAEIRDQIKSLEKRTG
ncbi:MAG: UvrB/UvrC motif-containing protein [Syntrophomonas sp.]|uniref:UvrB/UvrC motif-containing protein n=1 Tax=Syntrophomonas sp. TaxID=2053627 RepID=UPI002616BE10|nr:UvrB/UvrC motif-containing protein [Syntrophomonas sp.]MDD2509555.1 UvrB/UvrC motif-containing protein [Syntrophomonas sp.]MDD3878426.1 UvrB/UvrC motif-containing protein [Syntrophomonas sp.]MDD4625475.1 UvrB/UvrC motif-containing protein [Syntrophomonas sp.]